MQEPSSRELSPAAGAADPAAWPKVLLPERPLFALPLREVWEYRDLTLAMARRDVTTSYKQTILGPLWFIVQPLVITAVYSYLFGRMAGFGSDDIPHYLFYMGGLVPWMYFADAVTKTSNVFVENAHVFSKVYFPRLSVPLASLLTTLIPAGIQFTLFLAGLFYYLLQPHSGLHPNWGILAVPLVFLQLGVLALGMGCTVSALSRRFRDVVMGMKVGLQLLMFASAIVLPLSKLDPHERWIFFLNPVVPPVEFFRFAFLGKTLVPPWAFALSAAVSLLLFFIGLVLFNRAEQNAMDTV